MTRDHSGTLSCDNLGVVVPGRQLVSALQMTVRQGDFLAILGQNGAGKSLTLHTLAGLRDPDTGSIELLGAALDARPRKEIAQRLALLPQYSDDAFPATVLDTALSGRHPHVPVWQWESAEDRQIARDCLAAMDIAGLEQRDVATLSGGERRRLAVAQVLAQSPQVYLLDEPTNHLDPQHQLDVLDVFASRARNGATIIASLHDVNLAVRYASHCLLLFGDGRWQLGNSNDILNAEVLSELYGTAMEAIAWRGGTLFVAAPASTATG